MTRALLALLMAAGCSIPRPPPSPEPIAGGGARQEGRLGGDASPAQAAFCVSQRVPLSLVVLTSDGAAVRPAPGTLAAGAPDYALTVRRSEDGTTWLRQVGDAEPARVAAAADRLDAALAACALEPGGTA